MGGKQADRNAKKQSMKREEQEEAAAATGRPSGGAFAERAKALVLSSVLLEHGPKVPDFAKAALEIIKSGETLEKKKDESEGNKENEEKTANEPESKEGEAEPKEEKEAADGKTDTNGSVPDRVLDADACGTFKKLHSRLTLFNPLGLFASGEEAVKAWKAIKDLELDFGPRAKKKGTPKLDRIMTNVLNNLTQYIHVLFALMMLRAFLFRSFFACLPWLVFYQFLSADLPLGVLASTYYGIPLDKVPMEKVPVELRVVITVGLHGLVYLFFLYELAVKTYWFELILATGLIAYHAFAVRPVEA